MQPQVRRLVLWHTYKVRRCNGIGHRPVTLDGQTGWCHDANGTNNSARDADEGAGARGGGYADWFLPSAVELNEWRAPAEYWSSSQDDWCYLEEGNYTVAMGPVSGDQPDNLDECIHFVRPVRAF